MSVIVLSSLLTFSVSIQAKDEQFSIAEAAIALQVNNQSLQQALENYRKLQIAGDLVKLANFIYPPVFIKWRNKSLNEESSFEKIILCRYFFINHIFWLQNSDKY